MKPTKHTPGPWTVVQETGVKTLKGIIHCDNSRQAALISSAPELLGALEAIQALINDDSYSIAELETLILDKCSVISKARGE